jgi:hypothetical protein
VHSGAIEATDSTAACRREDTDPHHSRSAPCAGSTSCMSATHALAERLEEEEEEELFLFQ